ncbi:magnesium/cobalt transporter CorA [Candidatus Latescibacterota bacterium]
MAKFIKKISSKTGQAPGTLMHVGERKTESARITMTLIDYDESNMEEIEIAEIEEILPFKDKQSVSWINVYGVHDPQIIENVGKTFDIHPLTLEDILNTGHRPKTEDFESYLYIVLKMLFIDSEENNIRSEQVSFVIGENYVISFQEKEGDVFNPVRNRIRKGKGKIRKRGSDYLVYALVDAVVDNYYIILEKINEKIEVLEEELVTKPTSTTLQSIHDLKRETLYLRKSISPIREVIRSLERGESALIQDSSQIYFRDLYDHTIQIIETVETLRDMISGMLDIYLSSISNRMNEVMKTLTIFAAIFIPLTFIAGIYGMNFEHMPELTLRWAYPTLLSLMFIIGILLLVYFKKKNWL